MTSLDEELATLALRTAREAAAYITEKRPPGRVEVAQTKSSPTDVVTEIDQGTEALIRDRIAAARPDDGFVGEESEATTGSSGVVWIVDPIDGTVNFVYGLPGYAVSIAAAVDDVVRVGCVINVVSGEEFSAVLGAGAVRRDGIDQPDEPLAAQAPPGLSHALVGTGFNYVLEVRRSQAAAVAKLLEHVRDIRRNGSAAIDLCSVAAGRLDAYVEQGLKPWDLAAGGLIARESGVELAGLESEPNERLTIAAPRGMAKEFFALVRVSGF